MLIPSPGAAFAPPVPAGPWVVVVGMHRSGTSVLAGVVGALGPALPAGDDLMGAWVGNPFHYESQALTATGDHLLESLGGSWSAPPRLEPGWATEAVRTHGALATAAAALAFPEPGPLVWKDPRTCILLPFWRELLPGPPLAILTWRDPLAVAGSLARRDGFDLDHGLALWERYTHDALLGLRGLDTLVVNNEALMSDPRAVTGAVADWLEGRVVATVAGATRAAAAAIVTPELQRRHPGAGKEGDLLPSQRRLVGQLRRLQGPHRSFWADLPGLSPRAEELLAARWATERGAGSR